MEKPIKINRWKNPFALQFADGWNEAIENTEKYRKEKCAIEKIESILKNVEWGLTTKQLATLLYKEFC